MRYNVKVIAVHKKLCISLLALRVEERGWEGKERESERESAYF
jgi:hypothetical protein